MIAPALFGSNTTEVPRRATVPPHSSASSISDRGSPAVSTCEILISAVSSYGYFLADDLPRSFVTGM